MAEHRSNSIVDTFHLESNYFSRKRYADEALRVQLLVDAVRVHMEYCLKCSFQAAMTQATMQNIVNYLMKDHTKMVSLSQKENDDIL